MQYDAHPYAMVLADGGLVLVARDTVTGAVDSFRFEHMSNIAVDETRRFDLPVDFDLAAWQNGAFGVASVRPAFGLPLRLERHA